MKYKYKLNEKDYIELWGWITPEQIYEEYGERSHSPRQIRRYYEKYELPTTVQAQKKFIEETVRLCPEGIRQTDYKDLTFERIALKAAKHKALLWIKIVRHESLWSQKVEQDGEL